MLAAGLALGLGLGLLFEPPRERAEAPRAVPQAAVPVPMPAPAPAYEAPEAAPLLPPGTAAVPPPILGTALPPVQEAALPAWRRHAADVPLDPGKPMIGLVIDDLGLDHARSARAARLPAAVTLAYLPYAPAVAAQAAAARAAGHELLVHVSMEPEGDADAGPNTLKAGRPPEEIRARLAWALGRLEGYVGINNHMGSRFTADAAGMDVVLAELHLRGLLFLDSRTTRETVAYTRARLWGVPAASRQVFLDDTRTREAVERQLRELERKALAEGRAIAIGHPYDVTLDALEAWLPTLAGKGLQLAPLSALVESAPVAAARRP